MTRLSEDLWPLARHRCTGVAWEASSGVNAALTVSRTFDVSELEHGNEGVWWSSGIRHSFDSGQTFVRAMASCRQ